MPQPQLDAREQQAIAAEQAREEAVVAAASRDHSAATQARGAADYVPQILVNSVAIGLGVVRESDAIFPATAAHLADDLATGRLVALDYDVASLPGAAGIFHLRDRTLSPAARAFLHILREAEAQAPGGEPVAAPPRESAVKPRRAKPRR